MTVWPTGLRRWLQAPVRKGVGSNPTAVMSVPWHSMPAPLKIEHHVYAPLQIAHHVYVLLNEDAVNNVAERGFDPRTFRL